MKKLILPLIALSLTTMVGCKADVSKKVELVVYEYGSVDSLILSNVNGRVELPFETVVAALQPLPLTKQSKQFVISVSSPEAKLIISCTI